MRYKHVNRSDADIYSPVVNEDDTFRRSQSDQEQTNIVLKIVLIQVDGGINTTTITMFYL